MLAAAAAHRHHHRPEAVGAEVLPDPSPVAAVVLDIGEGFGALAIYTPAALEGSELEIRREGTEWRGSHTAVRRRLVPAGAQFAAVFGSLPEGPYQLRVRGSRDEGPTLSLRVSSAAVTEASWPGVDGVADRHPIER
ncbi:MAG: phospholipase [Acidimicrobiales bacterium]